MLLNETFQMQGSSGGKKIGNLPIAVEMTSEHMVYIPNFEPRQILDRNNSECSIHAAGNVSGKHPFSQCMMKLWLAKGIVSQ